MTLRANVGNIATSIVLAYYETMIVDFSNEIVSYLSISVSFNVLLTLMIVIRLILHVRNIRGAMGISGIGGMCNAITTMLIESCALYAVNSLLVIIPVAVNNYVMNTFLPILAETQVRTFPRPRSLDTLADMVDRTGDRCAAHHSTSHQ